MTDANLYVNVCIFVIISYAMRYPVKSIFKKQKPQKSIRKSYNTKQITRKKIA